MRRALLGLTFLAVAASPAWGTSDHFESAHVHPADLSPDGTRLFVVHTADHKLSVFDVTAPVPVRTAQVAVGVEPVTVRARTNDEVWVVNHISDSINLVSVSQGNVVQTLLVGDEPTDVVFAQNSAFVCLSQEDLIRVYDLANLDAAPVDIPLSMSDPRSLALSSDSSTVYVCALDSQNHTTSIPHHAVEDAGGAPPPTPPMAGNLPPAPTTALIVKHDGVSWRDETGTAWDADAPYTLSDHDVIAIDTITLGITQQFSGVGTALFNVAASAQGLLYVSNQEAVNDVRFEPNLKAQFAQSRVTLIQPTPGTVAPVHLNGHINYANPDGDATERDLSLAFPMEIAIAADGMNAFVAAMGSDKVGVLNASGQVTRRIDVGSGPTGVVLDESRDQLYVVNRFASSLSVVDLTDDSSVELSLGFDPSPAEVLMGRKVLYDATNSSAHGDLACATCHLFGGLDNIAWDLGDPQGAFVPNGLTGYHPMKGPMTTQSLKALAGTEPLHWRGDREDFAAFNPAFVSLLGRANPIAPSQMQAFEDFAHTMRYPPNPFRELDNDLPSSFPGPEFPGADPRNGETLFNSGNLVGNLDCVTCHAAPTGENGEIIPSNLLREDQDMVVAQLRNMYEKTRFDRASPTNVRGYGFEHDGAMGGLLTFLEFPDFEFNSESDKEDVSAFLLAFDPGTHAAVGAQWTMDGTNQSEGFPRVTALRILADQDAIGLIAKGRDGALENRGWVREQMAWTSDRATDAPIATADLIAMASGGREITFTAVLKGTEFRLGIDQDLDGFLDRDELDAGSDPGDPSSAPHAVDGPVIAGVHGAQLWIAGRNPARSESRLGFALSGRSEARVDVFDVSGRLVRTLVQEPSLDAGRYEATWNLRDARGTSVAPGVYFVRFRSLETNETERVMVVR